MFVNVKEETLQTSLFPVTNIVTKWMKKIKKDMCVLNVIKIHMLLTCEFDWSTKSTNSTSIVPPHIFLETWTRLKKNLSLEKKFQVETTKRYICHEVKYSYELKIYTYYLVYCMTSPDLDSKNIFF